MAICYNAAAAAAAAADVFIQRLVALFLLTSVQHHPCTLIYDVSVIMLVIGRDIVKA